jgi:hypothetical protein
MHGYKRFMDIDRTLGDRDCWKTRAEAAACCGMSASQFDVKVSGLLDERYKRREGRKSIFYFPAVFRSVLADLHGDDRACYEEHWQEFNHYLERTEARRPKPSKCPHCGKRLHP